jgi:hypothetical protein
MTEPKPTKRAKPTKPAEEAGTAAEAQIPVPVVPTSPARWSRAAILGFAIAVTPPFALIGSVCSLAAFYRSERLGLRGGTLAIAGAILGAISAMGDALNNNEIPQRQDPDRRPTAKVRAVGVPLSEDGVCYFNHFDRT